MINTRTMWLFTLPSGLLLAVALLWPFGYAVYLSLMSYNIGATASTFIGLGNYIDLLGEHRFWSSLRTTLTIAFWALSLEMGLGLLLALIIYRLVRGARTFIILLFLPHIVTPVVAALFLKWMFVSNWGLIDSTVLSLGLQPPDWLGDPFWAKVTIVLSDAWVSTPLVMLILYAALQQVDLSQIEAAKIDGAKSRQIVAYVMLPSIAPMIVFVASVRLMDMFRSFDLIYVLTGGGPGTATETITMLTYSLAFRSLDVGKASALGVITLLVVLAMVSAIVAFLPRAIGRSKS